MFVAIYTMPDAKCYSAISPTLFTILLIIAINYDAHTTQTHVMQIKHKINVQPKEGF